jgi:hypothetical protein
MRWAGIRRCCRRRWTTASAASLPFCSWAPCRKGSCRRVPLRFSTTVREWTLALYRGLKDLMGGSLFVYCSDNLVFSKLEAGRWPTLDVRRVCFDVIQSDWGNDARLDCRNSLQSWKPRASMPSTEWPSVVDTTPTDFPWRALLRSALYSSLSTASLLCCRSIKSSFCVAIGTI